MAEARKKAAPRPGRPRKGAALNFDKICNDAIAETWGPTVRSRADVIQRNCADVIKVRDDAYRELVENFVRQVPIALAKILNNVASPRRVALSPYPPRAEVALSTGGGSAQKRFRARRHDMADLLEPEE